MANIKVSSIIAAPVAEVWEYIRDFNGLPKWFPGVADSHIEPGTAVNQAGCVRNFGLAGGRRMREQLLELSDREHRFSYKAIDSPLPIQNYVATVQVLVSGNTTQMEISSHFDASPAQEKEMVGMLTGIYQGALELVKKHFGTGK